MRMKNFGIFSLLLFLSAALTSGCIKEEGEFGNATIMGKVFVQERNDDGVLIAQYYAAEERVYIVYGDSPVYNDDFRTHHDGGYRFDFLSKGTYTIFAYSSCDLCPSGTETVEETVEISKRRQTIELPDLVITKTIY